MRFLLACLVFSTACVVGDGTELATAGSGAPTEGSAAAVVGGIVEQPAHGLVIPGDPSAITVHVVAHHTAPSEPIQVQVLADPADLTSWTTIGRGATDTTLTAVGYAVRIDVRPVSTAAEAGRWPRGGVLRLRLIDSTGAPLLASGYESDSVSTIAVVNPQTAPTQWVYLQEKTTGSIAETQAYYTATGAPATLAAFMTTYGFTVGGTNETAAKYYNANDLAVGRDMHCRATTQPAGGLACYVSNYGSFDGDPAVALAALTTPTATPIATVAMVYTPPITAPNAVTFVVYNAAGARVDSAQLDTHGDNTSIPQNCINCHGGASAYNATTHAVTNARFLPFDPAAFQFGATPGMQLIDQQSRIYALNQLVHSAEPTSGVDKVIGGLFPNAATYDPAFVPLGWRATASDRAVYQQVVAPFCRGCHSSHQAAATDTLAFESAADFRAHAGAVLSRVCSPGPRGMPNAQASATNMFSSGARAILVTYLGGAGACAVP